LYISHLKLINFRSFQHLELDLSEGPSIFVGTNAQGKTTLLEAVYLLAIARAFRAENEREVVNWGAAAAAQQAVVDGLLMGDNGRTRVIVGYQPLRTPTPLQSAPSDGPGTLVRKEIRVGGVRRSAADLVGVLNAVLFSADDIQLVTGAPSQRRRFLDILISQADSSYLRSLQRYQKVLQQRNQLLKAIREARAQEPELDFWNAELAKEGAFITTRRIDAVTLLSEKAKILLQELTQGRETLQIDYRPGVAAEQNCTLDALMARALQSNLRRDLSTGSTSVGPHRDDFKLLANGVDMSSYSSRGQARTLALSLRLAEASYLSTVKGEPIVLLDDVLSELDVQRRRQVLERVQGFRQTLITTTDLAPFETGFLVMSTIYGVSSAGVQVVKEAGKPLSEEIDRRLGLLTAPEP
jgi:DNA replication and repair protein RecF